MDKNVKKLVKSVILTTFLVLISIPIWESAQNKSNSLLAFNDVRNISVSIGDFETLTMIEDERALENIIPTNIALRNQNSFAKEYDLIFLINKNSTVDYNYVRVSIDDNIYKLNEMNKTEDEVNYYFNLEKRELNKYTTEEVNARIWLDGNFNLENNNLSLTSNFIAR